jgi:hypothetical protein
MTEVHCFRCGENGHYANVCPTKGPTCYSCNRKGHVARDCKTPKSELAANVVRTARPTAQGRVYCMEAETRAPSNNLIQGDCEIEGTILTALFYYGATHSFISMECVERLKMIPTPYLLT